MAISTNSVIHYTRTINSLDLILKEGFKVKYCYEKVVSTKNGTLHAAFPMVSFCDIPLSQVKDHLQQYGCYGIGLKKSWAKTKKMSPVQYYDKDSELFDFIREEFKRLNTKVKDGNLDRNDMLVLIKILAYSKNYEDDLSLKDGTTLKNYRFYDEREWRFVPNETELAPAKTYIASSLYLKDKNTYNSQLDHIRLDFAPEEISYIIVDKEEDIKTITKAIRNIFDEKCSTSQLEVLLTKIITVDQIKYDF
jgi:hypothetical protein